MRHISIKLVLRKITGSSGNESSNSGFTLIEVAIIAPMMILIAIGIMGVLIALVGSTVIPNARGLIMQDQQKAFDGIESDINNSTGLVSTLSATNFTDGSASDYASPPTGTAVLMIQMYNQIANPYDATGTKSIPAFEDSAACSSATNLDKTNIAQIMIVYFVKNNILYRRTLVDKNNPAACGIKLAQQTCISCASKDLELVKTTSVKKFEVIYYSSATTDTVTTDPTLARSAKVTITADLDASGQTVEYTASIRVVRLNCSLICPNG